MSIQTIKTVAFIFLLFCLGQAAVYGIIEVYEVDIRPDADGNFGIYIGDENESGNIRYGYHESSDPDSSYYYLALRAIEGDDEDGLFVTDMGVVVGTEDPCLRSAGAELYVDGCLIVDSVAFRGDGTAFWDTFSDSTLKANFQPIPDAYETFRRMKFWEYEFMPTNKVRYGVTAQQMQRELPNSTDSIQWDGVKYLQYNPNDLIFLHMQATQELADQVEVLKTGSGTSSRTMENTAIDEQMNTLQTENTALKAELSELKEQMEAITKMLQNGGLDVNQSSSQNENLQNKKEEPIMTNSNTAMKGRLYDCQPNPIDGVAVLAYELPLDVQSASLSISNSNGQVIQSYPLTDSGKGQILFDAQSLGLSGGAYFYSLVVDGVVLETKQMVVVGNE